MSADNWAVCPVCLDAAITAKEERQRIAREAYGAVPIEEFDRLRREAAPPVDREACRTFREDWDFHLGQNGTLSYDYRGSCEECGANVSVSDVKHVLTKDGEVWRA